MPTPLSLALTAFRPAVESLAQAWLAAGATGFGVFDAPDGMVSDDALLLAHWPPDTPPMPIELHAAIRVNGEVLGTLKVSGLGSQTAAARLEADAAILAPLLGYEREMEAMTAELIDNQDQLLALYELTQSMRSRLRIEDVMGALVSAAARLVKVPAAAAILHVGNAPITAHFPSQRLAEPMLSSYLNEARYQQRELLLDSANPRDALPPGISCLVVEPIRVGDDICAALVLMNKAGRFVSPDLKLVRAIADQAGAHIENVLLYEESIEQERLQTEMTLARQVQARLLPQALPRISGIDLFAASRPARMVGGDFYDFLCPSEGNLCFTVGDVTGKGMPAALLMAMARTMLRGKAKTIAEATPSSVMSAANMDVYDDFTELGMFVTAFIGHYDVASRVLVYANAGHAPVIQCLGSGPATLLEADGTPLGVLPECYCANHSLWLGPGDVFVVATDGFSEAQDRHGNMFGLDRLLTLIETLRQRPAAAIAEALFEAVNTFCGENPQYDDQTILVLKRLLADDESG
jgi:sigma-B regulation protein RsbU (phosphoserine phosphatase)